MNRIQSFIFLTISYGIDRQSNRQYNMKMWPDKKSLKHVIDHLIWGTLRNFHVPCSRFCNLGSNYCRVLLQTLSAVSGYAGINLTGYYPPPGLTAGPLIFSVNPHPRDSFSVQNSGPRVEKTKQVPTPGYNLPSLNAKRSMKKEHNSIKAVSFQISHNCPLDNFLFS